MKTSPTCDGGIVELLLLLPSWQQRTGQQLFSSGSHCWVMPQQPFHNFPLIGLDITRPGGGKSDRGLSDGIEDMDSFHIRLESKTHLEEDNSQGVHVSLTISPNPFKGRKSSLSHCNSLIWRLPGQCTSSFRFPKYGQRSRARHWAQQQLPLSSSRSSSIS
jgi:hypothetical protein